MGRLCHRYYTAGQSSLADYDLDIFIGYRDQATSKRVVIRDCGFCCVAWGAHMRFSV